MDYIGIDRDELEARRSEITHSISRIESMIESYKEYGMDDVVGSLTDAKEELEKEKRKINEAIGKAIEKETEELVYDMLFVRY